MRKKKNALYLNLFLATSSVFATLGCSSMEVANNHVIVAEQDMWVTDVKGVSKTIVKGQKLEVEGRNPVLVEAPGRVSLIVMPPTEEPQEVAVRLKKISDWGGPQLESIMDQIFTESLDDLYQVQILLGTGKPQEALLKVRELRTKYPNVSYLQLVEISCLKAAGQRQKADALSQSLKRKRPDLFLEEESQKRKEASQ